jgi:NNP family nitrate/nitrite transporter-like MFS transporter
MGGFFLPNILGMFKELTNTYSFGFWWISITMVVAVVMMVKIHKIEKSESLHLSNVKTINS